jgi:signal transduction histidine kinase
LATIAAVVALTASVTAVGVFLVQSSLAARRLQVERIERLADLIAPRLQSAIAAGNRAAAARQIEVFTLDGAADAAGVYRADGSMFAVQGDETLLVGAAGDRAASTERGLIRTRISLGDGADVGDLELVVADRGWAAALDASGFAPLAVISALVAAGSLGGFLVRRVARPFEETEAALADDADAGGGERLSEKGPRELRELIERLNRLMAEAGQRGDHVADLVVQLREARDLAEASNAAKSRFLAHMSHELRTPLNAIMGYTKFVSEDLVGPEHEQSRDDLARVMRASEHLLSLIGQVLDLSKIEAGSLTLDLTGFDVGALLKQAVETSAPLAQKNGNILTLHGCPNGEVVVSDALRLRQCLLNVIGNALKFTSNGRVDVTARIERSDGGRLFVCEVGDTGPGIPEDKIEAVFEPFVQVGNDAAPKQAGTGLGLAITKRLCVAMGGDVRCRSELGRGSTFTIVIRDAAERVAQRAA